MKPGIFAVVSVFVLGAGPAAGQFSTSCLALSDFAGGGDDVVITDSSWSESRTWQPQPQDPGVELVAHCHVEGYFDRRIGLNDREYAIRFALNLPDAWNGRFLFQGGAGTNGILREPLGNLASGDTLALNRGFAVVSTDSGHQGQDPRDFADQEVALNFFFLANQRVTKVAKEIVQHYYSGQIEFSYFMGCSNGGREGMIMSQRYPLEYDGIVAGAPAITIGTPSPASLALDWLEAELNQVTPRDSQGQPLPGGPFSETQRDMIVDEILAACDALDGLNDGLIFNGGQCEFSASSLACPSAPIESEICINREEADALDRAFAGPIDSQGIRVHPGFPFDSGINDNDAFLPGILRSNGNVFRAPGAAPGVSVDVDARFREAMMADIRLAHATSTNLSSFAGNGSKLILYHGLSDAVISAMDTIGYFERMSLENGGMGLVRDWSRLFLVPGMAHCGGGERTLDDFDMVTAIVDWVEHDKAPDSVIAIGESMPGVSRPLCPYPAYAHYSRTGDQSDATSFECRY